MRRDMTAWMVAAVAASVIMTGCAKVPQEDVDAVMEALAAADAAEASVYAAGELEQAREAMRTVTAELDAQQKKLALLRSYAHAGELLTTAKASAEGAREAAVANREKARLETEATIERIDAEIATAVADLEALAACPRKPKGLAADLEVLTGRVEGLSTQHDAVREAAGEARFLAAIQMAGVLEPEVRALATDVANARSKLKC